MSLPCGTSMFHISSQSQLRDSHHEPATAPMTSPTASATRISGTEDSSGHPRRNVPLRVAQISSACTFCKARKIKVNILTYPNPSQRSLTDIPSATASLQPAAAVSNSVDKLPVPSQPMLQIAEGITRPIYVKRLNLLNSGLASSGLDEMVLHLQNRTLNDQIGMSRQSSGP
jgi:hypothetical protein